MNIATHDPPPYWMQEAFEAIGLPELARVKPEPYGPWPLHPKDCICWGCVTARTGKWIPLTLMQI